MLCIQMKIILSLEIIFSLHEERMKNIEAKNRSKENYLIILDKHMQDKQRISEEMAKRDKELLAQTTVFGNNERHCQANSNKK